MIIRSLYFDNAADKALWEKLDGVGGREKFRIRYYNDDLSLIRLEKKMKAGSLVKKQSTLLTAAQVSSIVNGHPDWVPYSRDALICELYAKMRLQGLRPRIIVEYIREPSIFALGNVRVTLDYQIRTGFITGGDIRIINPSGRDADGLDSNGNIDIEGGKVFISVSDGGGNCALDYGSENGGECVVEDASGRELLREEIPSSFSSVVLSTPELAVGDVCKITVGEEEEQISLDNVQASGFAPAGMFRGGRGNGEGGDGMKPPGRMDGTEGGEFPEMPGRPEDGEPPEMIF